MKSARRFVGVDLGAGSGRVMLGSLDDGKLGIEEVHRFPNDPVKFGRTLYWDFMGLLRNVGVGIGAAAQKAGGTVDGIGVDTWGVDFGLLDAGGDLVGSPVHYRDARTEGMMDELFRRIPRAKVFEETGIQFMTLNTLFQVAALMKRSPRIFDAADKMLLVADLVHYFLTGRAVAEFTLATTSQMWNPVKEQWSKPIIEALGIPERILPEIIMPGSVLAPMREDLSREASLKSAPPVIASACHDTAAAIAAVPASGKRPWAYLSSGTWSLLGVELPSPRITPQALEHNFTNEGGIAGTTRFLKNINGLWLVQECRRRWLRDGGDCDYGRLTALAEEAGPSKCIILPGDRRFFAPEDMPAAIQDFCKSTGQPVPDTRGRIVRCALESLALAYREVAERCSQVTGQRIEVLHIVGGGSRNGLLNQLGANALGVPVLAGPVEATAMGNILVQAMATKDLASVEELRSVVRASVELVEYQPRDKPEWDAKYAAYRDLTDRLGRG